MDMNNSKAFDALVALTKMHGYLTHKDLAGECCLRVTRGIYSGDTREIVFNFEFPLEYKDICTQVYYPECVAYIHGLFEARVELLPDIEADNRYGTDDGAEPRCGITFHMLQKDWDDAAGEVIRQVGAGLSAFIGDVLKPYGDFIKEVYNFVCKIADASQSEQGISDDD
jgi:hypothetical protein